jgi:hypothetical protein
LLNWLTFSWLASPRWLIGASSGVLICGQILWWRRRDNVLGYLLVATWVVTILVPLFGTSVVAQANPHVVWRVTWMLTIGAGAYLVGLATGGVIGGQSRLGRQAIWARPYVGDLAATIHTWARRFSVAALAVLFGAFALLGYVPALASDRQSAKYGVGVYAAGAARGGNIYHIGLAMASVALPIMLIVTWRRRSWQDLALCGALFVGLLFTLSREDAFNGPLLVVVALSVERRWKPTAVVALVCFALFAGTLVNEFVFPSTAGEVGSSFASRVAASAPDVHDQIAFMSGFETLGNHFVHTKNLTSVITPKKGFYDPTTYSIRTETLLPDVSGVGTGGIRLPGPEWGFVAYGWLGVIIWTFISGLFAGWGTVVVKQMLTEFTYAPDASVNYVLSWVYYTGTFGLLAGFFFPERADVVLLAAALIFSCAGWTVRKRRRRLAVNEAFWAGQPVAVGRARPGGPA